MSVTFILGCLFVGTICCSGTAIPNIAIVGGGLGGTSTAHFLRQLFGDDGVRIDLFEPQEIGGRLALAEIENAQYELGGSIIHPRNRYMSEFIKELGLSKRQSPEGRLGLYNGEEYIFEESRWGILTYLKLFWRYGNSLLKWHSLIDSLMNNFERIYAAQEQGFAFSSVDKLLAAMSPSFVNMTQVNARTYLKRHKFSETFIDELLLAIIRVNYGQTPDVNAFVGAVSLAGAEPGLWSVAGGNCKVPELLLQRSNSRLVTSRVHQVQLRDGKFVLQHGDHPTPLAKDDNDKNDEKEENIYDAVVIATPLVDGLSDVSFVGFPQPIENFAGRYHRTVATLIRGELNYTHLRMTDDHLDDVLTVNDRPLFNSLSTNYPVDGSDARAWKVFSQQPLSEAELDALFVRRSATVVRDWLAYPHYTPPEALGPFVLYPGLYYTSSIERAASAMELSVVAGRNAANLVYNGWHGSSEKLDRPSQPDDVHAEL